MSNLMVMAEFGAQGFVRDVRFDKNYLKDHRRAVILISEPDQTMWVWIGMETPINAKKQVSTITEKFKSKGYNIDGEVLGLNCNNIIIIDERILTSGNDPQMQQNYQQLLRTLDSLSLVPHGTSVRIVEVQEGTQVQEGEQVLQESLEEISVGSTLNSKDEALGGIFLMCLLHQYPDAFISRSNTGIIQFESSMGENFKFKVNQFKIQMLEGAVNEEIQNLYSQLIQNFK